MHPILIHLGPLTLRTYGALVAAAFLAALHLAKKACRERHLDETFVMNLVVLLVFTGLLGARLFFVLINASYFIQHPWESLRIWEGGLVFYGGFIVAASFGVWYVRRHKVAVGMIADALSPSLALGQAIGRLGCFAAGCCYGRQTSLGWGVTYQDPLSLAPLGIRLHPVQIYESIGNLIIAAILWKRLSKSKPDTEGDVFWTYMLLYGVLRFVMELFRADDRGPTLGGLYPSQLIALFAILLSSSILLAKVSMRESPSAPS